MITKTMTETVHSIRKSQRAGRAQMTLWVETSTSMGLSKITPELRAEMSDDRAV